MSAEGLPGFLRYRICKRFGAGDSELTSELPHLHQSSWNVQALIPGNTSNAALGSFTIPLHPPGSEGYANAKVIYDQLAKYQRVEAYLGYSPNDIGLGKLKFAGVITGIRKTYGPNSIFELTGLTDLALANLSRPFPGEFLSNSVTSSMIKSYLGMNELGWSDNFNPFTAANYVSAGVPSSNPAGTWTSTTDDGLNVVTNSTGIAGLLSKSGIAANDLWHTHYVKVTGRVSPSADATRAAEWGIGISNSGANMDDSVLGFVVAKKLNGRYNLDVAVNTTVGGGFGTAVQAPTILQNVDDPAGMIPFTIGLLWTLGGGSTSSQTVSVVVNGRVVTGQVAAGVNPGTVTRYPYLYCRTPNSGTANYYFTNLVQQTRFTTDGPSTAAVFGNGTITTSTNKLPFGIDPGPSFLEVWTKCAMREGWYLRYNPQAYVVGTRTLGTVDMAADPGTDRSAQCIFSRSSGNLISLEQDENMDTFVGGTTGAGQSTPDGGGLAEWEDISTLSSIGMIQDIILGGTHADFGSLRSLTRRIVANKVATGTAGSKIAIVQRDPDTADVWRELDKITIHDPETGVNMQSARIVGYTFDEGSPQQPVTLDQFAWHQ